MANQPTRPAGRARKTKPDTTERTLALVVRRGAIRRFDTLKSKTKGLKVAVTWDRRQSDRRVCDCDIAGDRRRTDRRQRSPYTWEAADFVVVEHPSDDRPPPKARSKKTS